MKVERRYTRRERPKDLSYVHFEPEGGGIVVNASEQGLAFHAATALRQTGPIHLCVSPNPIEQIKLTAEIAWMDEKKKSGGLRLTEVTADAKNQILQWLTPTSESEAPAGKFKFPPSAVVEETDLRFRTGNGTLDQLSLATDSAMLTGPDSTALGALRSRSMPATAFLSAPILQERQTSIHWQLLLRALATAFLILVLAFMPAFFFQHFRREVGSSLIRIGERLKGSRDTQSDAAPSIPVQISNPSPGSTPSVTSPVLGSSAKETLDHSDPAPSTQTRQETANSADSRFVDRHTRQSFAHAPPARGRSALARQLWSALGAGDSSAEVPLAQLYLTGDGVPRNCEQALVLLRVASKKGNIEARQQLRQLKKGGCR
jgi:hypothetical protein